MNGSNMVILCHEVLHVNALKHIKLFFSASTMPPFDKSAKNASFSTLTKMYMGLIKNIAMLDGSGPVHKTPNSKFFALIAFISHTLSARLNKGKGICKD